MEVAADTVAVWEKLCQLFGCYGWEEQGSHGDDALRHGERMDRLGAIR
jgi:hypothetical protein